jgi:hypothetical protein
MKKYFVGEQIQGVFGVADILNTPKAKFLIIFDQWKTRDFYNMRGLKRKTLKIDELSGFI